MGLGLHVARGVLRGIGSFPDPAVAGLARGLFGRSWRRFEAACEDPDTAQRARLAAIVAKSADTAFGKAHEFDQIHSLEDYRLRVPVRRFAEYAPWLERAASGEPDVLVPGTPYFFGRSSGTTGAAKLIPVTAAYRSEYRAPRRVWARQLVQAFPGILKGRVLSMHSPRVEGHAPGGAPLGSVAVGLSTRAGRPEGALREGVLDAVPRGLFELEDFELKYRAIVRFALQAPVSLVAAINPSTLVLLARTLETHAETYVEELRNGTFERSEELPVSLRRKLRKSRKVADSIEASVEAHGYPVWTEIFPRLVGLVCWTGGSAPFYVGQLARWFPGLPALDYGYIATEGGFAFPIEPARPGGVVAVGGHVLEFVPEEAADNGDFSGAKLASELELGARYRVVVTGSHGLYRYDMEDVVECTGRYRNTAEVAFVHKAGLTSSLTGEKLTEAHAVQAAHAAATEAGVPLVGASLGLEMGELPRYSWALEAEAETDWTSLLERLERALGEANLEYAAKRASLRLGPPRLLRLSPGSFARERAARVRAGAPDSQVKPPHLVPDPERFARLLEGASEVASLAEVGS